MKILNVKAVNKGAILYSFDIEFDSWGLTIRRCKYFESAKGKGIIFPSDRFIQDGITKYYNYIILSDDVKPQINDYVIKYFTQLKSSENLI